MTHNYNLYSRINYITAVILVIVIWSTQSQAQFYNDFDSDQLIEWDGDVDHFYIDDGRLKLRAPNAGSSALFRKYKHSDSLLISIAFTMDFAPSSSNSLKIPIVASDSMSYENGYYLYVGESGSGDALSLVKVVDGTEEELLRLEEGSLGDDPAYAFVEIEKYTDGLWNISTSYNPSSPPQLETIYQEMNPIVMDSAYFVIECNYTSSRRNSFSFDRVGVQMIVPDEEPPFANNVTAINSNTLTVDFNEPIDSISGIDKDNYRLNDVDITVQSVALRNNGAGVTINLNNSLQEAQEYMLSISGVSDKAGNIISDTSITVTYYNAVAPLPYDLIITEIMPNPQNGSIPSVEYVELYNRSDKYITTENIMLADRSTEGKLSTDLINPGEYVILCETNSVDHLSQYGKVIPVSSWPSLNNTGDSISLILDGMLIHSVDYHQDWYRESSFYNSGYSLELHNLDYLCLEGGAAWWEHEGNDFSSPGRQNVPSTAPIDASLSMKSVFIVDSEHIRINLNTQLHEMNSGDVRVLSGNNSIAELSYQGNSINITLSNAMVIDEKYQLEISLVNDCIDKFIYEDTITIGLPKYGTEKEICISEIMFDPITGSGQWIELYNRGNDYYDFSSLYINIYKNGVRSRFQLRDKGIFFPDTYVILCKDCDAITQEYQLDPYTIVEISDLESLDRSSGQATLSDNLVSIDSIEYDKGWHDALLKDTKGVSLARISCDNKGTSPFSWYSSPSSIGYASPGEKNEIDQNTSEDSEVLSLISSTISPDGDGYEDLLIIQNNIKTANLRASIKIYDLQGRIIKTLTNNRSLAQGELITWTGVDDNLNSVLPGMYIIVAKLYNSDGYMNKWKTSFSVVR